MQVPQPPSGEDLFEASQIRTLELFHILVYTEPMTELLIKLFIKKGHDSRQDYGVLAGIVGIICNLLLTGFKIATGLITGAVSIATDAVNNLSDAISSIVTLVGFRISGKPANRKHPYGHGRAEYLAGFIVAAAVIAVAISLFKESVENIFAPSELDVSITTIVILVVSILLKLWMSLFYTKIAKKISSEAMMATAVDSRSDCITTGMALVSVIAMLFFKVNIDGYAGAVVAVFVAVSGFKSAKDTIEPLLGKAPDPELIKEIEAEALSREGILNVHDIMIHEYGHDFKICSMHIELPSSMSLTEAHTIADSIERRVIEKGLVNEMSIHVDPIDLDDSELNELKTAITDYIRTIDPAMDIHDCRLIRSEHHTRLVFEVLKPYESAKTDEELQELLNAKVTELRPGYITAIKFERV
ncbi:cation diffusion facilitator family transporter [Ruminococcaceae bacterium YRB3002]|nr:cation diffusion facilitator family transporter [Ruminococcaceae bacterium YRB3002]